MRIQDVVALRNDQAVDVLKRNVIELYRQYIKRLQKGYKDDYSKIMDMINLIDLPRDPRRDTALTQYLLNKRP